MEASSLPTFPSDIHNACQLMASHGAYRLGAWHLLEDSGAAEPPDYSLPTVLQRFGSDVGCLCAHLNLQLASCQLVSHLLPLTEETLFVSLQDGVLLCAMANAIRPGTVDENLVVAEPDTDAQIKRNLNLAICSLETLGVSVSGLTPGSLRGADCGLYIGILLQALHRCLLRGSTAEAALVRWACGHLDRVTGFNRFLLAALPEAGLRSPECEAAGSDAAAEMSKEAFAHNLACLGLDGLIKPEHLNSATPSDDGSNAAAAQRTRILRLLCLARLHQRLESTLPEVLEPVPEAESTVMMWVNSLGVEPLVRRVDVDLRNGLALLQAWEVLVPGSVNWSTVELSGCRTGDSQELETEQVAGLEAADSLPGWVTNCAQVLECARQRGLLDEQSTAEGLAAGERQLTIALMLGMMRLHTLTMFQRAVDGCGMSVTHAPEDGVIDWANAQLLTFGTKHQLTGVEDPSLKVTTVLGYLSERILANTGRLVSAGTEPGKSAASARLGAGTLTGAKRLPESKIVRRLTSWSAAKQPSSAANLNAKVASLLLSKRLINLSAVIRKSKEGEVAQEDEKTGRAAGRKKPPTKEAGKKPSPGRATVAKTGKTMVVEEEEVPEEQKAAVSAAAGKAGEAKAAELEKVANALAGKKPPAKATETKAAPPPGSAVVKSTPQAAPSAAEEEESDDTIEEGPALNAGRASLPERFESFSKRPSTEEEESDDTMEEGPVPNARRAPLPPPLATYSKPLAAHDEGVGSEGIQEGSALHPIAGKKAPKGQHHVNAVPIGKKASPPGKAVVKSTLQAAPPDAEEEDSDDSIEAGPAPNARRAPLPERFASLSKRPTTEEEESDDSLVECPTPPTRRAPLPSPLATYSKPTAAEKEDSDDDSMEEGPAPFSGKACLPARFASFSKRPSTEEEESDDTIEEGPAPNARRVPLPERFASLSKRPSMEEEESDDTIEEGPAPNARRAPLPSPLATYSKPTAAEKKDSDDGAMKEGPALYAGKASLPARFASFSKRPCTEEEESDDTIDEGPVPNARRAPLPSPLATYSKPTAAEKKDSDDGAMEEGPALYAGKASLPARFALFSKRPSTEEEESDDTIDEGPAPNACSAPLPPPFATYSKPPAAHDEGVRSEGIDEGPAPYAKAGQKVGKKNPRQRNANANAMQTGMQMVVQQRSVMSGGAQRMQFPQVSELTSDHQATDYWCQTLAMFRQCGMTVFAQRLGHGTQASVFLDVLLQLQAAWLLANAAVPVTVQSEI